MLKCLFDSLQKRKSSNITFNQYSNEKILNNLKVYFEYLEQNNSGILMIGEAPGYKGCRLTGIPFTSWKVIMKSPHKIFKKIREKIDIPQQYETVSENTATIVWNFLENNDKLIPVFWNAFPFHPHKRGNPNSNRPPTNDEIEEGKKYIMLIYDFFKPNKLCGIGRKGEMILKQLFPGQKVIYIRHPSNGGKKEFIKGMKNLFL